jgi:VCBS repeat-containing protein
MLAATPVRAGILVIAPHPDDDIITSAGVIKHATSQGQPVTVVFVTNGDIDGTSQGYLRQNEAVSAQTNYLGTDENDLIFLGYPDGRLRTIYNNYPSSSDRYTTPFGQSVTYGARGLGRSDYHTYRFGAPATYNRANIVIDLQDIIATYKPQHIYTVSPPDNHDDHIATYELLKLALAGVFAGDPAYTPVVHRTVVHLSSSWPAAPDSTAYNTDTANLFGSGLLLWGSRESLDVPLEIQRSDTTQNLKSQAIAAHVSQGGFSGLLARFLHKDEVFWPENLNGTNQPPRAAAGFNATVSAGALVQLNGGDSADPDGQALAYQWSQIAGPTVALAGATTAAPSFTAPSELTQTMVLGFQLVVSDGSLQSAPDLVHVTIQGPQRPSTNIAGLATVTASSQNAGTGQLAVKAVDGVADGWPGDYTREWATNGQRTGAWLRLAWSSAYVIDQVVLYDRPNTDDRITGATLSFSDGSSVTVGSLNNTGSAVTVSFTPRTVTSLTLTVTGVSSTTLNVGLAEIQVYGSPAGSSNQPPTANAGADQSINEGAAANLPGSGSDPDGTIASYAWAQTAGPTVALSGANAATASFTAPQVTASTVLTFRLTVTDNAGATASDTVNVTVNDVPVANQPPTANAGPDQTVNQGVLVQLTGSGTDPEGSTLIYQWTQTAGPSVVLSNATTATPSFTSPTGLAQATVLTFRLTVTDIAGATGTDTVNVTVQAAQTSTNIAGLATVTASSQNAGTGQLAVKAVDGVADGWPGDYTREWATNGQRTGAWLRLAWSSAYVIDQVVLYDRPNTDDRITGATLSFSDGSSVTVGSLNNTGSAVTVSFTPRTVTSLTLTVTGVSSTTLNVGLAEIQVYGSPAGSSNQPPTANAGADQSINEGAAANLPGSGSDPDGTIASYAWAQTAGPTVALSGANAATASFTAPQVTASTVLTFRLTVTDNAGATASDTVNVTVNDVPVANQPPLVTSACVGTPAGTPIGNGVLAATDPEGQALTFELVSNGTKGSATVFPDGHFAYTPNTNLPNGDGLARGMDKFTFRATDPGGSSATATVTILIDGSVRILPAGDSITAGVFTSITDPPAAERVGYRRKLYQDLATLAGGQYGVNFVGQYSEGASASPPIGDPNHQGTPGQRDDELAASIQSYLNSNPADILLVHIGTNFFDTSATDVQTLLTNIKAWADANYPVTVFLARIIDDATNDATYSHDVTTFNDNVECMVTGSVGGVSCGSTPHAYSGKTILVNQQTGAGLVYLTGTGDMADDLHPTLGGYDKMAAKWYAELTNPANVGAKYLGLPQCP